MYRLWRVWPKEPTFVVWFLRAKETTLAARCVRAEEAGLAVLFGLGFVVLPAAGREVVVRGFALVGHRVDVIVLKAETATAVSTLGPCEGGYRA